MSVYKLAKLLLELFGYQVLKGLWDPLAGLLRREDQQESAEESPAFVLLDRPNLLVVDRDIRWFKYRFTFLENTPQLRIFRSNDHRLQTGFSSDAR